MARDRVLRDPIFFGSELGVCAKSDVPRGFVDVQANLRLEPLAPLVHEGDRVDRCATKLRGKNDDVVQVPLGLRIKYLERC